MYHLSIHFLFASIVACAAWALTSIRGASATTKYWIWVATACNFVVPVAALVDNVWALHFWWARPLGAIGGPIWNFTGSRKAVLVVLVIWASGAGLMLLRLALRLGRERNPAHAPQHGNGQGFQADSIPVRFDNNHASPSVLGVLKPRILLPAGLDQVLSRREFDAVLMHELAHARRHDNLIRLIYEASLCGLWFHPLFWFTGARMALFRELSCDECVIRQAHGEALVSALAKLAIPKEAAFLQATASSHLSYRLAGLTRAAQRSQPSVSMLVGAAFVAVIAAGVFQTIAHTACCFRLAH